MIAANDQHLANNSGIDADPAKEVISNGDVAGHPEEENLKPLDDTEKAATEEEETEVASSTDEKEPESQEHQPAPEDPKEEVDPDTLQESANEMVKAQEPKEEEEEEEKEKELVADEPVEPAKEDKQSEATEQKKEVESSPSPSPTTVVPTAAATGTAVSTTKSDVAAVAKSYIPTKSDDVKPKFAPPPPRAAENSLVARMRAKFDA